MELTSELYDEIIEYTLREFTKVFNKPDLLNHIDIAHEIIADHEFSKDWRKLVQKHIFHRVSELKIRFVPLDDISKRHIDVKYPCQGCQEELSKSRFQSSFNLCNKCYREKYKDRINANTRRWRKNNPDKNKESARVTQQKRKNKTKIYNKEYREKNRDFISNQERLYKQKNKQKIKEYRREYYLKNKK